MFIFRPASLVGASQQQLSTSQTAGPVEENYPPPNMQIDDIFPYAISKRGSAEAR